MKDIKIHIAYLIIILLVSTNAVSVMIDAFGTYSTSWQLGKDGSKIISKETYMPAYFVNRDAITFRQNDDSSFVTIVASDIVMNYGDSTNNHYVIPVADTTKEWISKYYGQVFMLSPQKTLIPITWAAIADSIGSISSSTSSSIADTAKVLYDVGLSTAYNASQFGEQIVISGTQIRLQSVDGADLGTLVTVPYADSTNAIIGGITDTLAVVADHRINSGTHQIKYRYLYFTNGGIVKDSLGAWENSALTAE